VSFAFGITIETDQLPTDLLYPYSSYSQSPTNAYSPGPEFVSLLESEIERSGDISMDTDRPVATTGAEVTASEYIAGDSIEEDGGKIAEEMQRSGSGRNDSRRTGSRSTRPGRADVEGAAKMEDHRSDHNDNDLRSSAAEVGSVAAKKALTDHRIALSSKTMGDKSQRSSETASLRKGDVGDAPKTALAASISEDMIGLTLKELGQLAGSSLSRNDGDASIPDSPDLSGRYLKSPVHNILSERASVAEPLKTGAGGHVCDSAKLVVVDLRASRESRKTERESERREPAVSRSRSRVSVVGSRTSVSDLEPEARQFSGIGDTQDIQKSGETDPNGAQTRLLARIGNQIGNREMKEGSQSERFGGLSFESRGTTVERFKEALRNEVVRRSSIILKEEGQGELRLILKPETLGNVRIRLFLNNNHIEGRIIVENSTVKEMFETNLQNLNNAFQRDGFSSSSLEVFVSGGNEQKRQREMQVPSFSAAQEFENSIPVRDEYFSEDWVINITV